MLNSVHQPTEASVDSITDKQPRVWTRHGVVTVLGAAAGVTVGAFVGQIWIGLGLLLGAAVGTAIGGLGAGLFAVLGVAVGEPVLRSVFSTVLHSWLYLPLSLLGLVVGALGRSRLRRLTSKS